MPFNFCLTGIVNVMELPATAVWPASVICQCRRDVSPTKMTPHSVYPAPQVPLGLNDKGLPVGVQVIANEGHDDVCLAVVRRLACRRPYSAVASCSRTLSLKVKRCGRQAMALERGFGGWVRPPCL